MVEAHRTVLLPLRKIERSTDSLFQQTLDKYQHCRERALDYCWNNPKRPSDLVTSKNKAEKALYDDLREETNKELHSNLVQKAIKDVTSAMSTLETAWRKGERISKPEWNTSTSWAMTYDARSATIRKHSASFATVDGRVEFDYELPAKLDDTPYAEYALSGDWRRSDSELVYRDGRYWLHLTVKKELPDEHWTERTGTEVSDAPAGDTVRVLGVDLNVNGSTAVTSAGGFHSNADHLNHRRRQFEQLRGELQQTGTRSAYKRLHSRRRVESSWFNEYAHSVANGIVRDAMHVRATHVVFEDLEDIRERMSNQPKYQQWLFKKVQSFATYKLEARGISVVDVDPRNTSRQCSHTECGFVSDGNRHRKQFECESCERSWNSDYNAARNIGLKFLQEEVPLGRTRQAGKATRQLALMSGVLSVTERGVSYVSKDWMSTDKPTALAVGS
jgi:IS605 OrfB family transposase